MKYINRKRYKKKAIFGEVNFPYGTEFECDENKMIMYKGKPVCFNTSQDAYDYFVRDDDGFGKERAEIINIILEKTTNRKSDKYKKIWQMLWEDNDIQLQFKNLNHPEVWLWDFKFYNADIDKLRTLLNQINGI